MGLAESLQNATEPPRAPASATSLPRSTASRRCRPRSARPSASCGRASSARRGTANDDVDLNNFARGLEARLGEVEKAAETFKPVRYMADHRMVDDLASDPAYRERPWISFVWGGAIHSHRSFAALWADYSAADATGEGRARMAEIWERDRQAKEARPSRARQGRSGEAA